MTNPDIHSKLFRELEATMPNAGDEVPLHKLEQLPYLTAVINEGLRLGNGVTHRLLRVFPDKTLYYNGTAIAPGTIVSMTSMLIHHNPDIFPDPMVFRPERWMSEDKSRLLHYLTPFSRGTRACLGLNLGYAELYLCLAMVFRRFSFEFQDVVRERDIDCVIDAFTSLPSPDSKGVMAKIVAVAE